MHSRQGSSALLVNQDGTVPLAGVLHGLFGVDHPLLVAQGGEESPPRRGRSELPTAPHQGELALRVGLLQTREVEAPEAPREDAAGQEEVRPTREPLGPVGRQAPGGEDTMEMRVMVQLLAPGVEHGEAADLRPEMRGVLGDVLERLGDGAKEYTIEVAGILESQGPQSVRQGKDDMDVRRVEHLALPGREPGGLGDAMTFGTAAVPARVVRLDLGSTVIALRDRAPEDGSPAQRDSAQGSLLLAREDGPIAGQKGGAMLAHHFGHCEWRATHGRLPKSAGNARASRGLLVAWSAGWATWR